MVLTSKLKTLDDLIESLEYGMEIEFILYDVRYYIGWPEEILRITWDNGYAEVLVEDNSIETLLRTSFNGANTIQDNWRDMEMIAY